MYNNIKFCPNCGSKIEEGQLVCNVCNYDFSSLQLTTQSTNESSDIPKQEIHHKNIKPAVSVTIKQKEENDGISLRMIIITLIAVIILLLLVVTIICSVDHNKPQKSVVRQETINTNQTISVQEEKNVEPEPVAEPEPDITPAVIIDERETQKAERAAKEAAAKAALEAAKKAAAEAAAKKAEQNRQAQKKQYESQLHKVNNPLYPSFMEPNKTKIKDNFDLPKPQIIEPEPNKPSSSMGKYGVTYSYRDGDMVISKSNSTNPKHLNVGDVVIAFNGLPVMFLTKETFLYYVNLLGKDESIVITVMRNGEVINIYAKEY